LPLRRKRTWRTGHRNWRAWHFDAGIIKRGVLHDTGKLAAILTSQAAGVWLDYVLRKGWPLLNPGGCRRGGRRLLEAKLIPLP